MHPKLSFFDHEVSSYAVMLVVALATGTVVAWERARRDGMTLPNTLIPGLAGIAAGLLGARLWSLVFELRPLRVAVGEDIHPADILAAGGLSVMGGLLLGGLGVWSATRARGTSMLRWIDAAAPGVAAAIGLGRVGCLFAGCCHGRPTLFPIALVFDDWGTAARPIGVPLHATQLYEAAACLALAAGLWVVPSGRRGWRAGWLFVGYGTIRALAETLRADHRGWLAGLPTTQVAALAAVGLGLTLLALALRRGEALAAQEPHPGEPGAA